ncbi:MAG: hypothetical protein ABI837_16685, partial [Acidobacteriota bacterium]
MYETSSAIIAVILGGHGDIEHRTALGFTLGSSRSIQERLAVTASNDSFVIGYAQQSYVPLVPPTCLQATRPSTHVEVAKINSSGRSLTPSVFPVVADLAESLMNLILRSSGDTIMLALSAQPVFEDPDMASPRLHRFLLDSPTLTGVERPPLDFGTYTPAIHAGYNFDVLANGGDFLVADIHLDSTRTMALFTTPVSTAHSDRIVALEAESLYQGPIVIQSDTVALVLWEGSPESQVEGKLLTR